MLNDKQLQALFLQKAEEKHRKAVPAYDKLKALVEEHGGEWAGDHIALRTTDERVAELIKEVGKVINLHRPAGEDAYVYHFPDKRLKSFDLLDKDGDDRHLKLFVSVWDESVTESEAAKAAIHEDRETKYQASKRYYHDLSAMAQKAIAQGGLETSDAEMFTSLIVDRLLARNGAPLKQSIYKTVAKESGELASAMVLGEGINHFTVDVLKGGYTDAEEMRLSAQKAGLRVLDKTQGKPGWLRQSSTMADHERIVLLDDAGKEVTTTAPLRFMEFIARPELKDEQGKILKHADGTPKRYARFEKANAQAIFAAASVKS